MAKLLNIVLPDFAVFGRKDYQQLKVIERMTQDLNFPVKIIPGPTVREKEGLAMSSRNSYLSFEERKQALCLSQALFSAQKKVRAGERDAGVLIKSARELIRKNPLARIEYIEIRDAKTLEPVNIIDRESQMLLAVWVGKTRLIDNICLIPQNKTRG